MPLQPHGRKHPTRTCRYWALGPRCPNVDAFGAVTCNFAHEDVGPLASHLEQRGTCLPWQHYGFCGRDVGCFYEHRDTGVTGLDQGTIQLHGLELQVADAATKAGFNTFHHEALFDLIWAVKRVGLSAPNHTTHQFLRRRPPPPKHPIYPDRYRPSGIGDNPSEKKDGDPQLGLKLHPIKPLMRKRPMENSRPSEQGVAADPTNDSDEKDLMDLNDPATQPKRQRVDVDGEKQIPNTLPQPPRKSKRGKRGRGGRGKAAPGPSQVGSAFPAVKKFPLTAANTVPILPKKPASIEEDLTKKLLLVKTKLDDARQSMNTCQATMKALFDTHYRKLDNDEMMMTLQKLSNHMNKAYDGSKDGMGEIDRAVALLNENKDGIL